MAAKIYSVCQYEKMMISGSKGQKAVHAKNDFGASQEVFRFQNEPKSMTKVGKLCRPFFLAIGPLFAIIKTVNFIRRGSMEKSYTVAQTVKMTGVKSYVLRYWEEELDLKINRNEMGHRCYTGYDIQLFLNIKELKKRGLQLRAIKDALPRLAGAESGHTENKPEEEVLHLPGKMDTVEESLPEKNDKRKEDSDLLAVDSEEQIKKVSSGQNAKEENTEKIVEFQEILERLIAQELHAKDEGEDRWRSLDEAIRRQQLARKEAAAASDKKGKKNSKTNKTCK